MVGLLETLKLAGLEFWNFCCPQNCCLAEGLLEGLVARWQNCGAIVGPWRAQDAAEQGAPATSGGGAALLRVVLELSPSLWLVCGVVIRGLQARR